MSTYSHELNNDHINVTAAAQEKIRGLLSDAGNQFEAVRIYVYGGGCSGMNYGMTFADQITDSDAMYQGEDGMQLAVDPVALGFLKEAEIDYVDDGVNATFVFNNVFKSVGGSGACGGCGSA